MNSTVAAAPDAPTPGASVAFGGSVARLAGLNGLLLVVAMISGPLIARALGPTGRGELTAVLTILALAPLVLDFGLADYIARECARGADRPALLGTAVPLAIGFSLLGVALAFPLADLIGQGRAVVADFVRLSLLATPVLVLGWLVLGVARGEQRWSILYRWQLINGVGSGVIVVALAVLGRLTVATAVVTTMATAAVALITSVPVLLGQGRWRFGPELVRPALAFGGRSWLIALSTAANFRLDQAVMAAVVSSAELGRYAVAASLTAIVFGFVSAVNTVLLPRVAREGVGAVPSVARASVLLLGGTLALLAATGPVVVPFVFGAGFEPAVLLVAILSLGTLFLGMASILGSALQGHGRPQATVKPQLLGLLVTIVGLALTLGPLGALGAALVSVAAYATVLVGTLRASTREFGVSAASLLVPRAEDVRWLRRAGRALLHSSTSV